MSVAVTVMMLEPETKVMADTLQELSVRVAMPLPPLSELQVMPEIPLPESEALPLRLRVLA